MKKIPLALAILASLCAALLSCGGPLYSHTRVETPTMAGNAVAEQTNVGGVVQTTTVTTPTGREMTRQCLDQFADWARRMRDLGIHPTYFAWGLANAPWQCMGQALNSGLGGLNNLGGLGFGAGPFNGRTFKQKGDVQ